MKRSEVEAAVADLLMLDRNWVESVVNDVPEKWDVPAEAKRALADLICWRAGFVSEYLVDAVAKVCWPDQQAATDEG